MSNGTAEPLSYKLSRVIAAHKNDVKAITTTNTGALLSASRDKLVKLFVERGGAYVETLVRDNQQIVNSVAFLLASDGNSLIFCGRRDGTIAVFNAEQTGPQCVLRGHTENVCVLQTCKESGQLISGSWDKRAIVFDITALVEQREPKQFTLEGHGQSIWGVEFVPKRPNHFLTASADLTIKLWNGNAAIHTFTGHTDVVRSLQFISDELFISAANDSTLRVWSLETGKCEQKYDSHTGEFIFSLARLRLPSNAQFIATCGEKGYLELWRITENSTLEHHQLVNTPSFSLWSLRSLDGGDVAAAADTGYIYIFTANPERVAPADVQEVFDGEVVAKEAKLAAEKSKEDSDTVTIKVSLDDGPPRLELKYVKGTDPADAAEKFIKDNNLPVFYLNEITEYIKANIPEARNYGMPGYSSKPKAQPLTSSLGDIDKSRPHLDSVTIKDFCIFGYEGTALRKAEDALKTTNQTLADDIALEDPLVNAILQIFSGDYNPTMLHFLALEKGLNWPLDTIVPILDAFRLGLLNAEINEYFCSIHGENRGSALMQRLFAFLISEPPIPVRILICRSIANAAVHAHGREMLLSDLSQLSDLVCRQFFVEPPKAALQLAAASCLANLALILLRQTEQGVCAELGPREDMLRAMIKHSEAVSSFSGWSEPALLRFLQAIITLMWGDATIIEMAKTRGVAAINNRIKDAVTSDECKEISRAIYVMTTD